MVDTGRIDVRVCTREGTEGRYRCMMDTGRRYGARVCRRGGGTGWYRCMTGTGRIYIYM